MTCSASWTAVLCFAESIRLRSDAGTPTRRPGYPGSRVASAVAFSASSASKYPAAEARVGRELDVARALDGFQPAEDVTEDLARDGLDGGRHFAARDDGAHVSTGARSASENVTDSAAPMYFAA
jgi:hypothetical protein